MVHRIVMLIVVLALFTGLVPAAANGDVELICLSQQQWSETYANSDPVGIEMSDTGELVFVADFYRLDLDGEDPPTVEFDNKFNVNPTTGETEYRYFVTPLVVGDDDELCISIEAFQRFNLFAAALTLSLDQWVDVEITITFPE